MQAERSSTTQMSGLQSAPLCPGGERLRCHRLTKYIELKLYILPAEQIGLNRFFHCSGQPGAGVEPCLNLFSDLNCSKKCRLPLHLVHGLLINVCSYSASCSGR